MSYYRFIDKGKGPTKLFVGGIHGHEGETTIDFLKSISYSDFSKGKTFIYNFDYTEYISTIKKDYYETKIGKTIINLIKKHNPDFYIELHCYNIKNYENLISPNRRESQGVPPLIDLENHVLISSVSPLIRKKYFKMETICKTLEIPCINKKLYWNDLSSITEGNINKNDIAKYNVNKDIAKNDISKYNVNEDDNVNNYNLNKSFNTYLKIIKILSKVKTRDEFQRIMIKKYPKQVELAVKYAKEIFGEKFPPF